MNNGAIDRTPRREARIGVNWKVACEKLGEREQKLPPEPSIPYSWKRPQLNHTGELKAPIWCTSMWDSSASNASASSGVAK